MKNGRMANKRILKWVASGVMLALLFAMVFAGTLSGAFGVENALQNSGVIENNVADAVTVTDKNLVLNDENDVSYANSTSNWSSITTNTTDEFVTHSKVSGKTLNDLTSLDPSGDDLECTYVAINAYVSSANKTGYSFIDTMQLELQIPANAKIISISANLFSSAQKKGSGSAKYSAITGLYYYDANEALQVIDTVSTGENSNNSYHKASKKVASTDILVDSLPSSNGNPILKLVIGGGFTCNKADWYNSNKEWVAGIANLKVDVRGFANGDGTSSTPYLLKTRSDFDTLSRAISAGISFLDGYFSVQPDSSNEQTAYSASDPGTINMGPSGYGNYTPGGMRYSGATHGSFQGKLYGNGVTIKNLKISMNAENADYERAGLIGTLEGSGEIRDLIIDNTCSISTDGADAGAFVGYMDSASAKISNCVNYASVTAGGNQAGGICANIGTSGGTIEKCKNYGTVTGNAIVGGITGFIQSTSGKVKNCYNQGDVSAKGKETAEPYTSDGGYVGGVAGISKGTIQYCYATGTFSTSNGFLAGIVAAQHSGGTLQYCYTISTLSAGDSTTGVGNVVGHTYSDSSKSDVAFNTNTCWVFTVDVPQGGNNVGQVISETYSRGLVAITSNTGNVKPYAGESALADWTSITTKDVDGFSLEYTGLGKAETVKGVKVTKESQEHAAVITTTPVENTTIKSEYDNSSLDILVVFNAGFYKEVTRSGNSPYVGFSITKETINSSDVMANSSTYGETVTVNKPSGYNKIVVRETDSNTNYNPSGNLLLTVTGTSGSIAVRDAKQYYYYIVQFVSTTDQILGYDIIQHEVTKRSITLADKTYFYGQEINTGYSYNNLVSGHTAQATASSENANNNVYGKIPSSSGSSTYAFSYTSVVIKDGDNNDVTENYTYDTSFTITVNEGAFGVDPDSSINSTNIASNKWGSANNPYIIRTTDQLDRLASLVNGTISNTQNCIYSTTYEYVQATNVKFSGAYFRLDENLPEIGTFAPIGKDTTNYFAGTFDGNDKSITEVSIASNTTNGGLFGVINGGTVKDLTCGIYINGGGTNHGGIVGQLAGGTIDNCKVTVDTWGNGYIGGVVGLVKGKSTISNCTVNTSPSGINWNGADSGEEVYIGGVVGAIDGGAEVNITNCTNACDVTVSNNGKNGAGGIVGYITAGQNIKIKNCINSGNVTAENANGVAGIVGYMASGAIKLTISGCKNTGTIKGIRNVGGIGGRMETTLKTADSLVIRNCYNEGSISAGSEGTVGGICGYLFANGSTVEGTAKIIYCYSKGEVSTTATSSKNDGAIVGNPRGNSAKNAASVTYCYTIIAMEISGTSNGFVGGNNYNVGTSAVTKSNGGKSFVHQSGLDVAPVIIDGSSYTTTTWDKIATYTKTVDGKETVCDGDNINGIVSTANLTNGQYFWTAGDSAGTTSATPTIITGSKTAHGTNGTSTRLTDIPSPVWYAFGADKAQDIFVIIVDINPSNTITNVTYSGYGQQGVENVAVPSGMYSQNIYFTASNANDVGWNSRTDVGTYDIITDVYINIDGIQHVVGRKVYSSTWKIEPAKLTISPTWSNYASGEDNRRTFTYNATQQGLISFTINGLLGNDTVSLASDTTVNTKSVIVTLNPNNYYTQGGTQNNIYSLNEGISINVNNNYAVTISIQAHNYEIADVTGNSIQYSWAINPFNLKSDSDAAVLGGSSNLTLGNTGAAKGFGNNQYYELNNALIYTAGSGYKKGSFVLYVRYNNGKYATLELGDDKEYKLETNASVNSTNPDGLHCATGDPIDVTLTATGKGNFTGSIEVTYTAMISDFGGSYGDDNWGSESNKFLISHPAHLIRLSEIVNGGKAWNSIRTTDKGLCVTNNMSVASNITTRSYQNAYFQVTDTIDLTKYFDKDNGKSFTPIGKDLNHAFSGAFDGDNTAHHINLYIDTTSDYAGLFGFVQGGTRTSTQNNGYYMTSNGAIIKNVTVTGSVKGGSYVGGIVGVAGYVSIENCINRASVTGTSYVGGIVGMAGNINSQVGWGRTATELSNTGKITATGENVGGIVGYSRDTTFYGKISNSGEIVGGNYAGGLLGVLCGGSIGNAYQSQNADISNTGKVTGGNYVGGITGKVTWASVYGTVSNSGQISGYTGVGGIVGAFNSSIANNGTMSQDLTSRFNAVSVTNNGAVDGTNYVGGIFGSCYTGYTASDAAYTFSSGTVTNTKNVTGTGTYIGGIAGWLESSANTTDIVISTVNSDDVNIYIDTSTAVTVTGKNCVGYLFGALVGNGYHGTSDASIATKLNIGSVFTGAVNGTDGGAVLGGLVGFMSKSVMMFTTNWGTNSITFDNMTNMSFVGGLVGMLGENGSIESAVTDENGSFVTGGAYTITANTTFGSASNRLGNFVGGIVGYVTSSAGTLYGNNANILGNSINLVNTGSIFGGSYVGGIYGAVGDFDQKNIYSNYDSKTINASYLLSLDPGVQGFIAELLWSGNFAGVRSGNTLTLNPTADDTWHQVGEGKIINKADGYILGDSYVGGLIGYVGSNMMITFENSELSNTIENLSIYSTSGNYNGILGTGDYIGGLIGYLSGEGHTLKNIVVRAFMGSVYNTSEKTISAGPDNTVSKYVGGIVGFMNSGTIENCVAMHTGNAISASTSIWKGAELVGGLVGFTSTGIIRNSYTTGFKFANTSSTRGGLVGMGVSATIEDSWAFYVADKEKGEDGNEIPPTYSTISKNSYGKYIAVDDDFDVALTLANIVAFVNDKQLTFDVTVPTNNKQLAFYDASGNDTVTNNIAENKEDSKFKEFGYANGKITIVLDAESGYSMLVYTTPVKFVNVAQGVTGETEKVRVAYRHPSSSEHYDADVTSATFTDGIVTYVKANIYFNPYGNECVLVAGSTTEYEYSDDGKQVGAYDQGFIKGSEASPYTISNWTEWQQFATSVKNGTTYSGLHVSLTQTISGNATGYLAGDATHSFMGTFNGNGYTINIGNITSASDGTSLFPYANGATFKNLTIAGRITSSQKGTAGFVGIAGGSLTFENCHNQVTISSSGKNVGGILGQSHNEKNGSEKLKYEFIGCVNEAYLENTINNTTTGMGGIVGNIVSAGGADVSLDSDGYDQDELVATVTLDSCRNAGNIKGTFNIAGIIGRNTGETEITNCGNSGNITANGENFSSPEQKDGMNTNVGGIGGLVTTKASINIYASYNSGDIYGWGNKAGGILAADSEYTASSSLSKIYYCYNTGTVTIGGPRRGNYSQAFQNTGVNGGGILGTMNNADIRYCYNTGTIIGNGINGGAGVWKSRIGGIVGFIDGAKDKFVYYCYNVGRIEMGGKGNIVNTTGAGQIVGSSKDNDTTKTLTTMIDGKQTNYSLHNAVYRVHDTSYEDTRASDGGSKDDNNENWSRGKVLATIADFTVALDDSGSLSLPKFDQKQNVSALYGDGIKQTNGGYVYVYGCLPQLAVFAVDTQNGLAMTSVAYGQNQYGEFEKQQAGGEYNPFVVKDGIDLYGIQSLVAQNYTFEEKYIEFADGTNTLSKTVTKEIEFPQYDSTNAKYSGTGYQAKNGNTYVKGKSYHLFSLGAVCSGGVENPNDNTPYETWVGKNNYFDISSDSYLPGGYFARQNFVAIGRTQANSFSGNISGAQTDGSRTKLVDMVLVGKYAGVFSSALNATISNIELSKSSVTGVNATGGIVARAYGATTVDNCAISNNTKVQSVVSNESVGGIVGFADTASIYVNYKNAEGKNRTELLEYKSGTNLTIKNCMIDGSVTISGVDKYVGGIVGRISESDKSPKPKDESQKPDLSLSTPNYTYLYTPAKGKNNIVLIQGCSVNGATISTTDGIGVKLGGVIGYGSENILTAIDGCTVGNSSAVFIKGKTDIGGIVGAMSKVQGGYIKDCTVGANATITATADCSNIGGIVGSSDEGQSVDSVTMTFQGTNAFGGTIDLNSKKATNIGGVIGTMNRGASFFAGSVINVTEKASGNIINPGAGSANIGGVAGLTTDAMFSGTFSVAPKMNTGIVDNVGGFIGKNTGTTHILSESTTITISGDISGATEVGGFIGINDNGASLVVGDDMVKGKPYTGTLTITVNATINAGGNNAGGIVGKNEGSVSIVKGTISTSTNSSVGGANNVGGIIGLNDGDLATGGSTVTGATLSITNSGSVSGENYVGGVFGLLNKGNIAGAFTNGGSVTASGYFAGGVIGYLAGNAHIVATDGKTEIKLTNEGNVKASSYAGGSIGFVEKVATVPEGEVQYQSIEARAKTEFINKGKVEATYFAGGSIGILYGSIKGTSSNRVLFSVEGSASIAGESYLGGSIGIIAGKIDYAQFTNSADLTITDGKTAIGGSVGFVGLPSAGYVTINSTYDNNFAQVQLGDIVISNSHFESTGSLKVDTTSSQAESGEVDHTTSGGVGGAIGVIGGSENKFANSYWTNNTYYAMANVIAPSVNNVGGVFGLVRADRFVINNMLAYQTQVQGNYNVGGIVGAITGANVKIASSFALEGKFSGAGNVGGIVGLANDTTDASTAYWMLGLDNTTLAGSNVNDLSTKLGFNGSGNNLTYTIKSEGDAKIYTTGNEHTGWFFLYANDANGSNGMGTINVTHKEGETNGVSNSLAYWKYIAQAYSVGETVPATMTGSALTSDSTISQNHVYATATAAPVANGGTGYYLYTQTSQEGTNPNITHYTTTDNEDAFYININTSQNVGNFVVYYRMITSGNALTYNGYQRIGVVGMDGVTIFTDGDIHNHTFAENEREKYYFTTATTETTEGGQAAVTTPMTNAGTYSSNINIYYVDKGGNVYNVGGNSAMTWTINKRDLGVEFDNGDGNRYYGSNTKTEGYDMKFVISNIAPGQYDKEEITITIAYNSKSVEFKLKNGKINDNNIVKIDEDGIHFSVLFEDGDVLTDEEKEYTNVNVSDWNSKKMTCYLKFDYAYTYEVSVAIKTQDTSVSNYIVPSFDKNGFSVTVRTLEIDVENWTSSTSSTKPSFEYNTYYQGLSKISIPKGAADDKDGKGLLDSDTVDLKLKITQKIDSNTKSYNEIIKAVSNKTKGTIDVKSVLEKLENFDFVGTYTVEFAVDGAGKYSMAQTKEWTITKYKVKFSGFSETGQSKVYDGTAVVPILTITDIDGENGKYTYKQDVFTLTYTITNSNSSGTSKGDKLVNVGKYTISLTSADDGEIHATRSGSTLDTSYNYMFDPNNSKKEMTYEITAREINIDWDKAVYYTIGNEENNTDTKATDSVYYENNRYYGLHVGTVDVDGATSSITTNTINKLVFTTGYGKDVITLKWNGKNANAGTHSMSLSDNDISGTNDGVPTVIGNYKIKIADSNSSYEVKKSKLYVYSASGSATKVYDGKKDCSEYSLSWTVKSSNKGNDGAKGDFAVDKIEYSDSKVGSWNVNVTFRYTDNNSNFERDTTKTLVKTFTGTITPKPIMVVLSGLRNGKATKVYDGDATYAGSISGNGTAGSRLGERFTVSGLLDNNVTISANYKEAVEDRSFFDSYVNGVFKNADNTYSQEANKYYKKLVFTMSGDGANNYKFNVYNATNQAYGKADGVGKDSTVTVYDSADDANRDNCGVAGGITIEITINSVRVTYSGTYQSYVDENGGYKEKWERVEGTISGVSDKDVVKVHNYWMYADGIDDELDEGYKRYTGYTVINGSKNSKLLYAEVSPEKGMQYNYRLSNQPTLTIAYFVSETGAFEIDSMSDLLIASFYYSASQNATAPEFVQIVKSGYKWVELVSNEEYEADMATWDAEFAKHEGVFLNETSTEDGMKANWWGYYEATEDSTGKTIPTSFKLTKDIYGMLTKDDIEKLTAFFTVAKSDDNGNITQTPYEWGNGKTYLANLLTTKEGSVITLLGSLFVTDSGNEGFSGSFDGNGYVIEYLNIMGYGYDNVGLFDVIGAGTVKDLHLRNVNINANKGNVGGIAGQIKASEENSAVSNVSFHGAINVSGNDAVNVGGLFGTSARAISNAIVLGTINSNNASAVVGGVVGSSSASISNVVSMMQINANGTNTGAFVGGGTNTNATDSYHMANAVYNGTSFVNVADSAKTYSELMGGSKTGYGTNKYYYESGTDIADDYKGTYDVLADVVYVNSNAPDNARQSMRLRDIVSVYLLMYSLSESNISTSGENKINVYTISSESWLVGDKLGTDSSPIIIANKQNVSLLRELRFATFTLASNIDVTISSTFSGAFYGTVNLNGHTLTCNQQMFDVYYKEGVVQTADWLTIK